jgi:hypothetical protein
MIVSVTKAHIKAGQQFDCQECPIALALLDATGASYVAVSTHELEVGFMGRQNKVPRSCYRFIRKFDRGEKVKPFNFRLVEKH